jgi:hypothetical protein
LYQAGSVNSLILLICFQNNRSKAGCLGKDWVITTRDANFDWSLDPAGEICVPALVYRTPALKEWF